MFYKKISVFFLCLSSFVFANPPVKKELSYLNAKPKHQYPNFSFVNKDAPKGGVLHLSTTGTFDGLNIFSIKGNNPRDILGLLYEGLMYRSPDEPFTLYPLIAKGYTIADDSSSITFFIDERACFSDKSFITAQDVKATFEALGQKVPRYKNICSKIKTITCVDSKTVRVEFNPMADGCYDLELPLVIAMIPILPAKELQCREDFTECTLSPIMGSGPYVLDSFEQGRTIRLKRNPNHWAVDFKGFYNFDQLVFDYYKSVQSQFLAFQSGSFDMFVETNTQNWNRLYDFPAVRDGRVVRKEYEHKRGVLSYYFLLNMRLPVFQDVNLRKAMSLALDVNAANSFAGKNNIPISTFSNTIYAPSGRAEGLEYDALLEYKKEIGERFDEIISAPIVAPDTKSPKEHRPYLEQADKLLTDSGYKLVLDKGSKIRLSKDGRPLTFTVLVKDDTHLKVIAPYQKALSQLGIVLKIQKLSNVQYENKILDSDFDIIVHAISNGMSPGVEQVYYYGSKTANERGSSNYAGIVDPVLENLARKIVKAKTREEHIALCSAMDRYLMHLHFFIPISFDNKYRVAHWRDRIDMPPYDPNMAANVIAFGWSKSKS